MTDQPKARGAYRSQRRRDAHDKPPLTLQERDLWMMRAIHDNRFLTRQLLSLLFPPDTARAPRPTTSGAYRGSNLDRRLAKLFHHGYLDRLRLVVGGELIYALTREGARVLRDKQQELPFPKDTDWSEKNRKMVQAQGNVRHALMVARFRIALTVALPRTSLELVSFQREAMTDGRYDLKADFFKPDDRARVLVTPDAFFLLDDPASETRFAYFLEADRSTFHLDRLMARLAHYATMYDAGAQRDAFGVESFNVVIITKSLDRARNIAEGILEKNSPIPKKRRSLFFVTSEHDYIETPTNLLAAVWMNPATPDTPRALIPSPLPLDTD